MHFPIDKDYGHKGDGGIPSFIILPKQQLRKKVAREAKAKSPVRIIYEAIEKLRQQEDEEMINASTAIGLQEKLEASQDGAILHFLNDKGYGRDGDGGISSFIILPGQQLTKKAAREAKTKSPICVIYEAIEKIEATSRQGNDKYLYCHGPAREVGSSSRWSYLNH